MRYWRMEEPSSVWMGVLLNMNLSYQVLDLFDELFVSIFKGLKTKYAKEIETVNRQFPFEEFQFLEPTLRLKFKDAIQMLREAGVEVGDYDDLR